MQWLTWLSLNLFAHARCTGAECMNEWRFVSCKSPCEDIKQNSSNKIGNNTQRLKRIVKYSLDIFAYSKHIQIIGRIPTICYTLCNTIPVWILLLFFNMPHIFLLCQQLHQNMNPIMKKTRTLRDFHSYNLLSFFSYIQNLFKFFLILFRKVFSTLFYCSLFAPIHGPLAPNNFWAGLLGQWHRRWWEKHRK